MTDREVLIGLAEAIMAIGEKLTGQKMLVKFPVGDDLASVGSTKGRVKWFSETEEEIPHSEVRRESLRSNA